MNKLILSCLLIPVVYTPANASLNFKTASLPHESLKLISNAQFEAGLEPTINDKGRISFGKPNYFYDYSWLSKRRIKESELLSYSPLFLDLLRNSIFARYGRKFITPALQSYFNSQPWYTPRYEPQQFPALLLTAIEQHNVDTIIKYQQKTGKMYFGNSSSVARSPQNNSNSRAIKPKPVTNIQNTSANSSINEIWKNAQLIHTIGDQIIIDGLVFSSDKKTLVSSGQDIKIWNLETGELLKTIDIIGREKVESLALSPDGKTLAVGITVDTDRQGNKNTKIEVWDLETEELLYKLSNAGNKVVITPDNQTLIAALSSDYEIQFFSLRSGELQQKLLSKNMKPYAVSISLGGNGEILGVRSALGILELWNLQSQKLIRSLNLIGHYNTLSGLVAISPDGKYMVNNGYANGLATNPTPGYINISGHAAQIWKLSNGELIRNLEGHSDTITAVAISPNSKILATGSVDGTIRIINLQTRELIRVFKGMGETRAMSFSSDSRTLAGGGTDGKIKIWQIP